MAILEGDSARASECDVLATHDHIVQTPGPVRASGLKVTWKLDESGRLSVEAADGYSFRGAA